MTWSILLASCVVFFTACSDDDEGSNTNPPINPLEVFTSGLPKSAAGMLMSYTNGLLTKIVTNDGEKVLFDYGTQITNSSQQRSSSSNGITMSIYDEDDNLEYYFYNMAFGNNGFLKSCSEKTYDEIDGEQIETWSFEYNKDGHLISMKRSEGDNEVTSIKYENGNITEVSMTSDDDDSLNVKVFYTSTEITTPIKNKNCIMLFDITFGIDMDEMNYAYWAGFLGKATKSLPVMTTSMWNGEEYYEEETETFEWIIKNESVLKMIQRTSEGTEEYLFSWE